MQVILAGINHGESKELRQYGESLGLANEDLIRFIESQQAKQRDDRRFEREREKEEWEVEKVRLEHELELKRLDNTRLFETEKHREEKGNVNPSKVPKLPPFEEGTDDMDAYLRRYERYAISQKWDKSIWATHLSALLKGNALNVYALLPSDQALDYDALKTCLLKRYNMTEDGFKQKFRSCRPEFGETFQQFSVRLGSYFSRWIDMSNVLKTFDGLYDLMLRDQFLHICNNEVMLFLKERVPKSIDDMTRYADQFKEARRVNIVSLTNQTQKGKPQPSQKPNNARNQEPPKQSDRDRNRHTGGYGGGNRFDRKCFKCNKSDHLISNCPLLKNKVGNVQNSGSRGKETPICGNVITLTDSIITTQVSSLTIPDQYFCDTGCNGVVIKKSLVSIDCFLDDYQTCVLADGSSVKVPIAIITIDSPYYQGEVKAWCMEQPLYDVIIGNIDGAREPYDPDISPSVSVVTRQQAKKRDNPYPKLKVPGSIKDVSLEDIEYEQQSDASLSKLRQYVAEGRNFEKTNGTKVNYILKKKLMYREFMSPKVENGKLFRQLVVPEVYRSDVMKLAHESLMAGHMATRRTVYRVLSEFYWPGVESDVKRYCQSCDICQRTVPKGKQVRAPLGKTPIIDVPFRRVAVDIVGPLVPVTDKGNRYILTLVDYATRYPEGVALPSIETERVAEALIDIFCRVGFPREMLTDMGAQFTSNLMSEVSRLISLRQLTTTPYHPMCNGLVERFNGTMKLMLKRLCAERPRDWDKYLGPALFAYREVPQESVLFSPFELVYGWPVRGPMTILKELWTREITDPEVRSTYEYVINLRERLESTCELVKQNLEKASRKQSRIYNRKSRSRKMKVGQKVLVLLPTKANKLLMHWKGPFSIVEKISDLDYRIDMRGKLKMFHVNMLKLYVEREQTNVCVSAPDHKVSFVATVSVIDLENEDTDDVDNYESELIETPVAVAKETLRDVHINEALKANETVKVQCLLDKFSHVLTDIPGRTNVLQHDIKLTSDDPVRFKPYPIPYAMLDTVNKEVDKMIEMDIIERSDSPYSSPFVIVKKKDQSNRFCIDFRGLNSITIFDAETMGNIEEMFSKLSGYQFISKIDLTKGYWQISLVDAAKPKTAFQTPRGLFQFKVLPFGLVNSGATFVRCMRKVLEGLENVDNFVDDIIVYTRSFNHHMEVLESVFERLASANLSARPSKCYIAYSSLEVLGHIVGTDRLSPNPDKIEVFILQTDASDNGIGAILLQDEGNIRLPVSYASKKLKASERNYSTIEKECLAIVWAISKFQRGIVGIQQTLHSLIIQSENQNEEIHGINNDIYAKDGIEDRLQAVATDTEVHTTMIAELHKMIIMSMNISFLFLFAVSSTGLVKGACPSTCSCVDDSSGSNVDCNSTYLGRIPALPNDTYYL
ncbi:unnamed protein product [Mytilus edulis]|uniref:Reverse transcriptase n=1 Tax=Mytilus edulis TaxID=6550 RepID=A0A8S3S473_MYTED|nr:unnamed protein product [Mytilus edulis]